MTNKTLAARAYAVISDMLKHGEFTGVNWAEINQVSIELAELAEPKEPTILDLEAGKALEELHRATTVLAQRADAMFTNDMLAVMAEGDPDQASDLGAAIMEYRAAMRNRSRVLKAVGGNPRDDLIRRTSRAADDALDLAERVGEKLDDIAGKIITPGRIARELP